MKRKGIVIALWGIICLLGFTVLLTACGKKEAKTQEEKVFNVHVGTARTEPLRPFIEAIGSLNPNEEVTLSAEVEGSIRSIAVDEGSVVHRGMVMAALDDTDYGLEVRRADAAVKQAEATLANTKLEFGRKEALYKEELVTKQQYDDVTTRLALADAELDRNRAALALARQKLSKTRIVSPISCVVKEKKVSAGDFVKNGTPLFVIIQSNPVKLLFNIPEKEVGRVRINQDVFIKVDSYRDREFKGRVSIIYPSVEERTRTLPVEALVPNPEGLLKPGFFAKVILYTAGAKDTVVVPITSILYEADTTKVFVVEGDRAKERKVRLGSKYGELMEIVEGVKAGETIVVAGQANLSQDAKVSPQKSGTREGK
jgi:membrane fusion protein (multidrug efflux system)